MVANNAIRRCAFTAVRNNGGAGVVISANSCAELGETAIFAEFDFEGCVIADNSIDGAVCGVQMVNFADHGGRAAVCTGNVIRNLRPSQNHSGHEFGYECGIKVEADATVSANVIEGAPWVGILVGWGASLRDVTVTGNVVRDAPIGIGVSIAEGAGSAVDRRQRHRRREPRRGGRHEFRPTGHGGSRARRQRAAATADQRQSGEVTIRGFRADFALPKTGEGASLACASGVHPARAGGRALSPNA